MFIILYALLLFALPFQSYASDINSIQTTIKKVTKEGNYGEYHWDAEGTTLSVHYYDEPTGKGGWIRIRPDGSHKEIINGYDSKRMSANGNNYLFADKDLYLCIGSLDGSKTRRMPNNARAVWDYRWSPDGKKFAFLYDFRLYLVNTDGSHFQELINFTGKGHTRNLIWSPDGASIALGLYSGASWKKYNVKEGITLYMVGRRPLWSPDSSIIYSIDDGKLYAFKPASLSLSADLANAGEHDVQFFDIDFSRGVIAYIFDYSASKKNRNNNSWRKNRDNNIWITNMEGLTHRKITDDKGAKATLSFNKDGRYIAYYHQDPFPEGSGPADSSPTNIYVIELYYPSN
jgi:Tol biopolymer transport system component